MATSIKRFLLGFAFLVLLFVILGFSLPYMGLELSDTSWGILAFVAVSTCLVHVAFMFGSRQSGQTSIGLLMGTIVGHMLINILFILPVLYFNQEAVIQLTFVFFVILIVFMIYEITMIALFINSKTTE